MLKNLMLCACVCAALLLTGTRETTASGELLPILMQTGATRTIALKNSRPNAIARCTKTGLYINGFFPHGSGKVSYTYERLELGTVLYVPGENYSLLLLCNYWQNLWLSAKN